MPTNVWHYRVDLKSVFRNEEMTFEECRDEIVRRLRASRWLKSQSDDRYLADLIDELADTRGPGGFDYVWDCIYNQADVDRCWIATF